MARKHRKKPIKNSRIEARSAPAAVTAGDYRTGGDCEAGRAIVLRAGGGRVTHSSKAGAVAVREEECIRPGTASLALPEAVEQLAERVEQRMRVSRVGCACSAASARRWGQRLLLLLLLLLLRRL